MTGAAGHACRRPCRVRLSYLVVALAAAVLLALGLLASPARLAQGQQESARPTGRIVVPRGLVLYEVDAATGGERAVYTAGETQLVLDAALTPDGQTVVFSRLDLARRDDPGGASLFRLPLTGGEPILVAARDVPGATLTTPLVTADGAAVLYTYTPYSLSATGPDAQPRIERVPLEGGERTLVAWEAEWPAPSPDGRQVAYVRRTTRGDALWLADQDGGGREVIPPTRFLGLAYPRISPDGMRIAVVATIDLPTPPAPGLPRNPFAWRPARPDAHGLPWDIWTVALDGSDLTRLTQWYEDDPSLAWSPDGRWLAAQGGGGLRLLEVASGRSEWLGRQPAFGAIDWARE